MSGGLDSFFFYPWKQNISINVIIYLPYNIVDKCDPKFSRAPNDTTYNAVTVTTSAKYNFTTVTTSIFFPKSRIAFEDLWLKW